MKILGGFLLTLIGTFLFMLQLAGLLVAGGPGGGLDSIVSLLSLILAPAAGCGGGYLGAVLDKRVMRILAAALLAFIITVFLFFLPLAYYPSPVGSGVKPLQILSIVLSPLAGAVAGVLAALSSKERTESEKKLTCRTGRSAPQARKPDGTHTVGD